MTIVDPAITLSHLKPCVVLITFLFFGDPQLLIPSQQAETLPAQKTEPMHVAQPAGHCHPVHITVSDEVTITSSIWLVKLSAESTGSSVPFTLLLMVSTKASGVVGQRDSEARGCCAS